MPVWIGCFWRDRGNTYNTTFKLVSPPAKMLGVFPSQQLPIDKLVLMPAKLLGRKPGVLASLIHAADKDHTWMT